MSVEHWINDALMAVFFLRIGLELERELYNGELSNFKNALLPIFAAMGGICLPALIHRLSSRGNFFYRFPSSYNTLVEHLDMFSRW